jgi:hypothetical protein
MGVARNASATAADQKVEVGAQVRLLHGFHIQLLVAALGRFGGNPQLAALRQYLVADL